MTFPDDATVNQFSAAVTKIKENKVDQFIKLQVLTVQFRYFKKQRVFPRCIQLTLLHDKELFQLTRGAIVPQGGVKPFIHPMLERRADQPERISTSEAPTAHNREDWYGDGGP